MQYFAQTYGAVNSQEFHRARSCFVQSLAGYCLVSFLLQVRERSQANFLIDDEGHVIHCDFTSILSAAVSNFNCYHFAKIPASTTSRPDKAIDPECLQPQGGSFMGPVETLTFMGPAERAPFRVTPDMLEIMGGSVDAEPFKYFNNLVIRWGDLRAFHLGAGLSGLFCQDSPSSF